ncbi:unnamed protein product [Orchesella dallaii]|uniref:Rap-GAP domain-containing protein n=1 Tax=Orchesella dallaii TaxID=48710 RepID=A0ABP1QWJ8_9HEXA
MYWEWTALSNSGNEDLSGVRTSVLEKLPVEAAKDVVLPVVRHIVSSLGISQPPAPSTFTTDGEIEWCLQVICHGLSLPFSEHDIIKDCVSIYCEWLSCLAPVPKISVPKPVADRPNFYARSMINHFYHLFSPRKGEGQDTINRQAVLCHRVLRVLQNSIRTSEILDAETWECILLFLIGINNALLSPPSIREDIGDQLCERVLSVLFEVWLLACGKSFPSPPLWKTLRESCQSWRHRANLFDQWNRINLLLVGRTLNIMYGPGYIKLGDDDGTLVPVSMSEDAIVQTWFRFLHCLGNPVELTQPTKISQTQNFLQYAIASEGVVDPCQHPCLSVLPTIFHQAMQGIAALVDAFLGFPPKGKLEYTTPEPPQPISSPVPPMRRLAKSFSVSTSTTSSIPKGMPRTSILGITTRSKDTSSIPSSSQSSIHSNTTESSSHLDNLLSSRPSPLRPRVNSILHLFGPWLFEAALISCDSSKTDGEVRRTSRGSAVPAALPESIDIPNAITIDKYYQGRAEAIATLCRIFCSKKTGEDILPAYLARFYIAVRKGLKDTRHEVLISILSNSSNLLRVDLDGVTVLVPVIVTALEAVLPTKDALRSELRRSAIQLLLSLLALPLHFLNVPIRDIHDKAGHATTFIQLKPRLANVLISALQVETDSLNIQMLLGGLIMLVSDTAAFEDVDKPSVPLGTESPTNLLSSENVSMRSYSDYSNSFDEHTYLDPSSNQIDSAHALFVRATYLVCHRLISSWKTDLPVSLAALELLNGLAKIKVQDQDPLECRRAVKWVCDFIIHQCSRPPKDHSKDLHSSIVAAFQCVTTWLTTHPYLLDDKESLFTVLEVVEFGISGTKSQGKPGEPVKLKNDKDLKPVSLRVRDAAEALLAVIFEQVGRYNPCSGVKASVIDEYVLLGQTQGTIDKAAVINQFRYFVIDHSILIALHEEPLANDPEPQPTLTAIIRGPMGQNAWCFQLRHLPRYKGKSFSTSGNSLGRPLPMNDVGLRHDVTHRYFPEMADRIPNCRADKAIPPLDSSIGKSASVDQDSLELNRLSIILENQIRQEKSVANHIRDENSNTYPNLRTEAQAPPPSSEFQTARLLLSHLGYISPQINSDVPSKRIIPIDSNHSNFISELEALDQTSYRTNDTVHIFYVKSGQRKAEDILSNVQSRNGIHPHFMEFLLALGWPVNVLTSWKRGSKSSQGIGLEPETSKFSSHQNESHGGSLYNGEQWILYWADVTSEVAFVVPTEKFPGGTSVWNLSSSNTGKPQEKSDNSSHDDATKNKKQSSGKTGDSNIFVVWLESFEDSFHFPASELLSCANAHRDENKATDPSLIIFIHSLKNGLFRIHMEGEPLRMGLATPLIDGMVVSRRVLGNLVRQTSLNMARRKRLENESYQPPHVRRKLKVQEIMNKFPCTMSPPEFYSYFFQNPVVVSGQNNGSKTFPSSPETSGKKKEGR